MTMCEGKCVVPNDYTPRLVELSALLIKYRDSRHFWPFVEGILNVEHKKGET